MKLFSLFLFIAMAPFGCMANDYDQMVANRAQQWLQQASLLESNQQILLLETLYFGALTSYGASHKRKFIVLITDELAQACDAQTKNQMNHFAACADLIKRVQQLEAAIEYTSKQWDSRAAQLDSIQCPYFQEAVDSLQIHGQNCVCEFLGGECTRIVDALLVVRDQLKQNVHENQFFYGAIQSILDGNNPFADTQTPVQTFDTILKITQSALRKNDAVGFHLRQIYYLTSQLEVVNAYFFKECYNQLRDMFLHNYELSDLIFESTIPLHYLSFNDKSLETELIIKKGSVI